MTGKTTQAPTKRLTTLDELRATVDQKYIGVPFEHPEGYGTFEVARLQRREREEIAKQTRRPDGTIDVALQNRMAAAFGLVGLNLTADDLLNYPDDFIEPIADKVWEMSNEYRDRQGKDGADVRPFTKRSSVSTDSPPPADGSPSK